MARRCGPAAALLVALALGAAWGAAADDDDLRCTAGWQPVEAGAVLDLANDVTARVAELANATGVLTCSSQPLAVADCPRAWQGATRHRLYLNVSCTEAAREVTVALEVDALGAADGTVRGIDVDVEHVWVDGQRIDDDDLEGLFGDDDPREDVMENLEDRIEDLFGDDDDILGDDDGDDGNGDDDADDN